MTPSQLVLYTDMADLRLAARFDEMVIAARIGNADQKSYNRWRARRGRQRIAAAGKALTGERLERAVMGLAAQHPEYVVVGAD